MKGFFTKVTDFAFEYETQKMVQIQSKKIGVIFRLMQLVVILYFIIWVIWLERGYQSEDKAVSGVTAKLKGVSYMDLSHIDPRFAGQKVWDAADYVIPPQQNSAFFITTNLVVTPNQTQGVCDESFDVFGNDCEDDSKCEEGRMVMLGSGRQTGRCVNSTIKNGLKVCEIYGWCPTEFDHLPIKGAGIIHNAPNFTVLLKNSIEFPKLKVKRRNALKWMDKKFFYKCNYQRDHPKNKFCPIFRLGDILKYADADTPSIWIKGGMVSINIAWECDLDKDVEECVPEYSFRRLDDPVSPVAKGWNFRYSNKYVVNGKEYRTLIKAYGIQFFITVYGRGYKFDWYTLTMNIGSGIGLLGVATVICDMIILNVMRNRGLYRDAKVDLVSKRRAEEKKARQEMLESQHSMNPEMSSSFTPRKILDVASHLAYADDLSEINSTPYHYSCRKDDQNHNDRNVTT